MSLSRHASVGMMGRLLDWFRGALPGGTRAPSGFPALFRVRDENGELVERVLLRGVFEPSGRRIEVNQPTAGGVCMVTWPVNAQRLVLELSAKGERAAIELEEPRPDPSRVIEVQLENAEAMLAATAGTCSPAVP